MNQRPGNLCRSAIVALLFSIGCFEVAQSASAEDTRIWFGMGALTSPAGRHSWELLYRQPHPAWPDALTKVAVMGVLTQALVKIPEPEMTQFAARLKEKNIGLGVEMLAQAYAPPGCGGGVEGYFPPDQTAALAAKVRRANGAVQYVAMDEPVWYGHYYDGAQACHSSIDSVAERVAVNLREYLKVFPDLTIGDIEPFPSMSDQPNWQADYSAWRAAVQKATGKPIAYLFVDVDWARPNWEEGLKAIAQYAQNTHLALGIIYNASPPAASKDNQAWLNEARQNFAHIERDLHIKPQWAMFTSWTKFPGHAVTDENGLGEDYLVKEYLKGVGSR
jgi:hypothetical protein